jgi:hypothetical protein
MRLKIVAWRRSAQPAWWPSLGCHYCILVYRYGHTCSPRCGPLLPSRKAMR